jgi:hypothetical protein
MADRMMEMGLKGLVGRKGGEKWRREEYYDRCIWICVEISELESK